jgi:hypothetical protein
MPFFFTEGLPDQSLDSPSPIPFAGYDKNPDGTLHKFIDNKRLDFTLDQCRFDP